MRARWAPIVLAIAMASALGFPSVVRAEAEEVESFDTLEEMVDGVDAVVLGRLQSVTRVGAWIWRTQLAVDAVLAGAVNGPAISLDFFTGSFEGQPTIGRELPAEQVIAFLRLKDRDAELFGAALAPEDRGAYRLVVLDALATNLGAATHFPTIYNSGFLEPFEGIPFEAFVAQVAALGGVQLPAAPGPLAPAAAAPAGPGPASIVVGPTLAGLIVLAASIALLRRRLRSPGAHGEADLERGR